MKTYHKRKHDCPTAKWNKILATHGLKVVHPGDDSHELSYFTKKRILARMHRHLKKRVALERRGGVRAPSAASKVQVQSWENEPLGVVGFGPMARSEAQAQGSNPGSAPQAENAGDS